MVPPEENGGDLERGGNRMVWVCFASRAVAVQARNAAPSPPGGRPRCRTFPNGGQTPSDRCLTLMRKDARSELLSRRPTTQVRRPLQDFAVVRPADTRRSPVRCLRSVFSSSHTTLTTSDDRENNKSLQPAGSSLCATRRFRRLPACSRTYPARCECSATRCGSSRPFADDEGWPRACSTRRSCRNNDNGRC